MRRAAFRSPVLAAVSVLAITVGVAGCSKPTSAGEAVRQVDAACQRVRVANAQLQTLDLGDKAAAALDDPSVKAVIDESVAATKQLAEAADSAATANQGRLGKLRRTVEEHKELIGQVADYAVSESKDSVADRIRKLRKVADIVGADACAGK